MRIENQPRKKRPPVYGRPVRLALETLGEIFDPPGDQRLQPMVAEELDRLKAFGELDVDTRTVQEFKQLASGTINRQLAPTKTELAVQMKYGRISGNLTAKKIPLKLNDSDFCLYRLPGKCRLQMDLLCVFRRFQLPSPCEGGHNLSVLEIGSA